MSIPYTVEPIPKEENEPEYSEHVKMLQKKYASLGLRYVLQPNDIFETQFYSYY